MDNLEEMDRFLEKFNLPRLNQEKIEIMNKTIINTEIETVIKKKTPQNKSPGLDGFTREGNGTPLQYSCLENSMDRGAW